MHKSNYLGYGLEIYYVNLLIFYIYIVYFILYCNIYYVNSDYCLLVSYFMFTCYMIVLRYCNQEIFMKLDIN